MEKSQKPNGVAYWRGTVDTKLEKLEHKLDEMGAKIDKLTEKVERMNERQKEDHGRFVEWEYVRDKFTVPIVVAAILFLLLTIGPAVIVLVNQ